MTTKTPIKLGTVTIIAVLLIALLWVFDSGVIDNIQLGADPTIKSCVETPFNDDCYCAIGYDKIPVSKSFWQYGKWYCEPTDLFLDPDSPTFETDAIEYVQGYLSQNCGDTCVDLECGGSCRLQDHDGSSFGSTHPTYPNDRCISAVYGQGSSGERIINVECVVITEWDSENRPSSGTIPWRMNFFVESAEDEPKAYDFFSNYCSNGITRCEPPVTIVPYTAPLSIFGMLDGTIDIGSGYPAL